MRMSEEIRRAIGAKLREARIAKNETQTEVGTKLGLSRQMISRYEKGHDAPTADNLARALRYFGISIDLPGYRLTAESLETPTKTGASPGVQFELPYGKPQEFLSARVRVTRERGSLQVVILSTSDSEAKS
jgi:transcriptional regulator with XRE-family HTH domain